MRCSFNKRLCGPLRMVSTRTKRPRGLGIKMAMTNLAVVNPLHRRVLSGLTRTGAVALGLGMAASASAVQFEIGPIEGSVDSLLTAGAAFRVQDRANHLIGKSNLNPGLCVRTNRTDNPNNDAPLAYEASDIGDACSTSSPEANQAFVDAPGSFSVNSDDGNLNYDKHDIVSAAVKLNSEISFSVPFPVGGFLNFYANPIYFFDADSVGFDDFHPDTTLQPQFSPRPATTDEVHGANFDWASYHLTGYLPFIGDRELVVRVGRQGLNWGESTALVFNSINAINPPHGVRARLPGFQLEEAFQAVGMAFVSTSITPDLFLETFYQYEWKPAIADPVGTFFSVSDTVGAGGRYAMLSFAKQPEDPENIYQSSENDEDPVGALTNAGRTVQRIADRRPEDGGQYGFALKYFASWLNNGTELAFYHANYHARIPSVSALAANPTCIGADSTTIVEATTDCAGFETNNPAGGDPLPVDTLKLFVDYPEDIKLYGLSFNTTVGDLAISGEYSFRENLPVQIHSTDVVYAALQPAFPNNSIPIPSVGVIPSRRAAVPDFAETLFRNNPVDGDGTMDGEANYEIQGWVPQRVHQLQFTLLNSFGGSNWFDADQILTVFEFGGTLFPDMPELSELQFNGAEVNTHASTGADGTTNGFDSSNIATDDDCNDACRQNPTAQPLDHFPTEFSWGIRSIALFRYQNALFGANIEPLLGFFWDVNGIAPGLGQNFVEGNKQILTGLRFDYLNKWIGEVRLTTFTGGSDYNSRRDRDNLSVYLGYTF